MSKYSYKGRKKVVERFTNWHGLGILVAIGGTMEGSCCFGCLDICISTSTNCCFILYAQMDHFTS
jgi:hypothetical protein